MTGDDEKELATLREFAGGKCTIRNVIDALGPMSLWSKDAFEREIAKAVSAEREAIALTIESMMYAIPKWHNPIADEENRVIQKIVRVIRSR